MKSRFGYLETDVKSAPGGVEIGQSLAINFNVSPAVGEVTITNANSRVKKDSCYV